jgi:hypothetical protein
MRSHTSPLRRPSAGRLFLLAALAAALLTTAPARAQSVSVVDAGLVTGFQDLFDRHLKRGRALVAADFDLDGRVDFYLGNPGDESFIVPNVPSPLGSPFFLPVQVLVQRRITWGAASADYDNDGDYDLFIATGGNEGYGYDYLFKNLWIESGETQLTFQDVTAEAGGAGPVLSGQTTPWPVSSANAVWGDYDLDGDVDLFVNVNITFRLVPEELRGCNILWRNEGNGTFTDVTEQVGLAASHRPTRNSTFVDIDNDGDLDLYETNFRDINVLWKNELAETGRATFTDATLELSLPGEDLRSPLHTFASAAADLNNDGWQDLIAFFRFGEGGGNRRRIPTVMATPSS